MLRGKMVVLLLMIDHVRRGEMAERRRVLMETCRHHGCDWWKTEARGRLHLKTLPQKQIMKSSMVAEMSQPLGGVSTGYVRIVAKSGTVWYKAGVSRMLSAGLGVCRQRCQKDMQVSRPTVLF
jgi:hypothetical protein